MTTHTTTVTAVTRHAHDISRIVLVVRCSGCKFRFECMDEVRAKRAGALHVQQHAHAAVTAEVSGE